jgi:hypothetical protein
VGAANEADVPVDQRALSVARLGGRLYGRRMNQPAIVVGGGPSAPSQLLRVFKEYPREQCTIISANGHAAKLHLPPDFIVCKDHVHTETKELMEPPLRAIGATIVARHYWADFRIPSWPIQGNSGMMALGLAALMGCAPIFPVGFDCYEGDTYFHTPDAPNVSKGLRESHWRSRYQRLRAKLLTADIRLLERSPLSAGFPLHTGAPGNGRIPPVFAHYAEMAEYYVRARGPTPMYQNTGVIVPPGYVFPVDADELRRYTQGNYVDLVDNPT